MPQGGISWFIQYPWFPPCGEPPTPPAATVFHSSDQLHTLPRRTRPSLPQISSTAHSLLVASTPFSQTTSPLCHGALDNKDHSLTHQPTVVPLTTIYLLTLTLAHDDQVKPLPAPTFLATFWDLLPFLCACGLAPLFASLLVLLVGGNSNNSKVFGEQQS